MHRFFHSGFSGLLEFPAYQILFLVFWSSGLLQLPVFQSSSLYSLSHMLRPAVWTDKILELHSNLRSITRDALTDLLFDTTQLIHVRERILTRVLYNVLENL